MKKSSMFGMVFAFTGVLCILGELTNPVAPLWQVFALGVIGMSLLVLGHWVHVKGGGKPIIEWGK